MVTAPELPRLLDDVGLQPHQELPVVEPGFG